MPKLLKFDGSTNLEMALRSGAIPAETMGRPVLARGLDGSNSNGIEVLTDWSPSSSQLNKLAVLGVAASNAMRRPGSDWSNFPNWLALIDLQPRRVEPEPRGAILFEVPGKDSAGLSWEMLRLGNDRQSFLAIDEDGERKTLLRVTAPPFYTLLRASGMAESEGTEGSARPIAYREVGPGVWVALGWAHPLERQFVAAPGELVRLTPGRGWRVLTRVEFRDLYDLAQIRLPSDPLAATPLDETPPIEVPLRLGRATFPEPPTLWIVPNDAERVITDFVRVADETLLDRLLFAVAREGGENRVILRSRPSSSGPPVLALEAVPYRAQSRIPNLFAPIGTRVVPPLRRDALVQSLAEDPELVTCLVPDGWSSGKPEGRGIFTPWRVPESAFRPLSDWVEYRLDRVGETLDAWIGSNRFDFDGYVVRREPAALPPKNERTAPNLPPMSTPAPPVPIPTKPPVSNDRPDPPVAPVVPESTRPSEPSEAERLLEEAERRFVEFDGPPEAPERIPMWRNLAALQNALGNRFDATLSLANLLWHSDRAAFDPLRDLLALEFGPSTAAPGAVGRLIEPRLRDPNPSTDQVVRVAIGTTAAGFGVLDGGPASAAAAWWAWLPDLRAFLERHDALIPIRLAWFAWLGYARIVGGDPLTLARSRDRLLGRLHARGLRWDLDLPGFLKRVSAGSSSPPKRGGAAVATFRVGGKDLDRVRALARNWLEESSDPRLGRFTLELVDRIFAFAHARAGEGGAARELIEAADRTTYDESLDAESVAIREWCRVAFGDRILEAMSGRKPALGLSERATSIRNALSAMGQYHVDKLAADSEILSPASKRDGYRATRGKYVEETLRVLAELEEGAPVDAQVETLNRVYASTNQNAPARVEALDAALRRGPMFGEEFAKSWLARLFEWLVNNPDAPERGRLLGAGVALAAHFDRGADLDRLAAECRAALADRKAIQRALAPNEGDASLANGAALRDLENAIRRFHANLCRAGRRDVVRDLLDRLQTAIDECDSGRPRESSVGGGEPALRCRLARLRFTLAGGFHGVHEDSRATRLVDRCWSVVERDAAALVVLERFELLKSYLRALEFAPPAECLKRVETLLNWKPELSDNRATSTHFSLARLGVVEAAVLALTGETQAIDARLRRWIEDEDFVIRKRVHADFRAEAAADAETGAP